MADGLFMFPGRVQILTMSDGLNWEHQQGVMNSGKMLGTHTLFRDNRF
jgi:hypothetical protein